MSEPFDRRIDDCRNRLEQVDADVVVLFPSPNLAYATGVADSPSERHFLLIVPRTGAERGMPTFVAPSMYAEQLAATPIEDEHVRLYDDGDEPLELVDDVLTACGVRRSGDGDSNRILVDDTMWAVFTQDLRRLRPNATYGLASDVFEPLRITKDEIERDALRRAGALADRVALEIRERREDVIGTTEAQLAAEIDRLLGTYASEYGGVTGDTAFDTIVAVGENGARPHHHPGSREIEIDDPVVLDFGAFVEADLAAGTGRYPGDQTRTVVFDGEPSEEYKRAHELVRTAQVAAIERIEPGVTAETIDRAARSVIEDGGYGDAFVHRTGHGVGLEVHEPPYIVDGNETELEAGMVFSVEPGIYLEGEFGVRIEDLVVVTGNGCERLNDSPRTWE